MRFQVLVEEGEAGTMRVHLPAMPESTVEGRTLEELVYALRRELERRLSVDEAALGEDARRQVLEVTL